MELYEMVYSIVKPIFITLAFRRFDILIKRLLEWDRDVVVVPQRNHSHI